MKPKFRNNMSAVLRCDIPIVYQLQCRNKCEQCQSPLSTEKLNIMKYDTPTTTQTEGHTTHT